VIFGSESISHYTRSNISVWMIMAFQAGVLNIGGFMACHRFVSHVTGFATFFGYEISQSHTAQALGMLSVPMFFLLGAMISGYLVDLPLKLKKKPRYFITFGIIFALILIVFAAGSIGWFGVFGEPLALHRDYLLLALLCLTCGIQNGTVTTVSRSIIRTTHLTGITTDLGLGIIRALHRKKFEGALEDRRANWMRMGIIASFGLGSIAGGFAFHEWQYFGFILPVITSGSLFAIMFYFQVLKSFALKHS